MSATTINYVQYSFNICIGCRDAGSPGCDHCYARDMAHRFYPPCFDDNPRRLMSDEYWRQPLAWERKAEREGKQFRVLCGSMCDIFDDAPGLYESRERLWKLIDATPSLFWMLLTKRPEHIDVMIPDEWNTWCGANNSFPPNVALGVTVETQAQVWRIQEIMQYNCVVYWVSHEPALGKIDWPERFLALGQRALIVTGGESGHKARPMHPDWARHDRDQCVASGINYWFKQWGEWAEYRVNGPSRYPNTDKTVLYQIGIDGTSHDLSDPMNIHNVSMGRVGTKNTGRLLDGREWNQLPENLQ